MEIKNLEDFGRSLSSQDVANFLGVSVTTVYSVAEEFGGVRVGKKYVFFERLFFERLKAKVQSGSGADPVSPPVLPGFDVGGTARDLSGVADPHGLLI